MSCLKYTSAWSRLLKPALPETAAAMPQERRLGVMHRSNATARRRHKNERSLATAAVNQAAAVPPDGTAVPPRLLFNQAAVPEDTAARERALKF